MRRYLVVVPPDGTRAAALFQDVESDDDVGVGDRLLVDDLLVRVRFAIDVPVDDEYAATLVCTPDDVRDGNE